MRILLNKNYFLDKGFLGSAVLLSCIMLLWRCLVVCTLAQIWSLHLCFLRNCAVLQRRIMELRPNTRLLLGHNSFQSKCRPRHFLLSCAVLQCRILHLYVKAAALVRLLVSSMMPLCFLLGMSTSLVLTKGYHQGKDFL